MLIQSPLHSRTIYLRRVVNKQIDEPNYVSKMYVLFVLLTFSNELLKQTDRRDHTEA